MNNDFNIKKTVKYLKFTQIQDSDYQPSSRQGNDPKYLELKEKIKQTGLINEPQVDVNYKLIDGHRRVRAMKELGYEGCNFEIIEGVDSAELFAVVNKSRDITIKDDLEIFLKGGEPANKKSKTVFRKLVTTYGSKIILKKIMEKQKSPVTIANTMQIVRHHIGNTQSIKDKDILDWLILENNVMQHVRDGIVKYKLPKNNLKRYIKSGEPIPPISSVWNERQKQLVSSSKQMSMIN